MSYIKSKIFLSLSKTQKSALCNYLRALVKKSPDFCVDEIFKKFIEDEEYYFKMNNPHFEFLSNFLFDEDFKKETLLYLNECKKYYDYKKSQKPLVEAQKNFEKEKRNYLKKIKMSKETPTKKQLYYYDCLCKKYSIDKKDTSNLSKLDLKNMISEILDEYSRNSEHIDLCRD
ncbi:hypothetical protein IKE67_01890 [bacterium]|nr:hypothetical protein [bacterium]